MTNASHHEREPGWKTKLFELLDELDELSEWRKPTSPLYEELSEAVMREPWLVALQHLVERTGTWTGTEEELLEEVRLRVDPEVWGSEDFPTDLQMLSRYLWMAKENFELRLYIHDYHEMKQDKEELKKYDMPKWGAKAPILVQRDWAALRPRYDTTLFDHLLVGGSFLRHPLALAVLRFTYHSNRFTRTKRQWSGGSTELGNWLMTYYPAPQGSNWPLDPVQVHCEEMLERYDETREMLKFSSPSDYAKLHKHMKACAPVLEKAHVKLSWVKVPSTWTNPKGVRKRSEKTRWTIEAPYWNRDFGQRILVKHPDHCE